MKCMFCTVTADLTLHWSRLLYILHKCVYRIGAGTPEILWLNFWNFRHGTWENPDLDQDFLRLVVRIAFNSDSLTERGLQD